MILPVVLVTTASAMALSSAGIVTINGREIKIAEGDTAMEVYEKLRDAEKRILQQTLAQCDGDKNRAMAVLHMSRSSFYDKCKEYGIK